jgi:hypothetical protein
MAFKKSTKVLLVVFILSAAGIYGQSIYEPADISEVKSSLDEMGKMWTFDSVPVDYFEKEYGFKPSEKWLDDVMKSALQFTNGCSAAFVSSGGLIMTNHHCGRHILPSLSPAGKDYLRDGYYANILEEEIKAPDIFVDQLLRIENVTDEVIGAMNKGASDSEKVKLRDDKIKEIEKKYSEQTGLVCNVVELYHGGKYSVYMHKRYDDIRLVMAPDFQIASTGWDWDNFTYPRYELDFMFFRAYENDKPVKVDHFFKFSKKGAEEGEPIFTVGRPGSTQRLISVAQLEFLRDKTYKYNLSLFNEIYKVYFELFEKRTEQHSDLLNKVMSWGNARKSYAGRFMALRDDFVMAKKKDFEKEFREKVNSNPELKNKYGNVWDDLKNNYDEYRKYIDQMFAYNLPRHPQMKPVYYSIAEDIIKYAEQMNLPEDKREADYKADKLAQTISKIFPDEIDAELQQKLLRAQLNYAKGILGGKDPILKKICGDKTGDEAAEFVINNSAITTKEKFNQLIKKSPDEILNSDDPFIYFLQTTQGKLKYLRAKVSEIGATVEVLNQLLGEAGFKIYGDKIPPDATLTLRISDGRIKGYEYNGTLAPGKTTFYGLYDKWNSFGKKEYPWGLHPRWQKIPEGLDLATTIAFASTNDIVGGNSGSSVINKNKEVVGLVHDGNLESLGGDFIFLESNNRTVATDSWGLMEALKYVYKTDRLVEELSDGKIK